MNLQKLNLQRLVILSISLMVFCMSELPVQAVTYEPLPNRPEYRGFCYWLDMADYSQLLVSNMPYRIMQGYIVADSVVRTMPSITYLYNPIQQLNLHSDTVAYLYKYWYLMNEYDPLRFYAFLRKYPNANNSSRRLYSELRRKMEDVDARFVYAFSDYILHVYVNNTVWVDTINTKYPNDVLSETISYCRILDTLKGGAFPLLDNSIFYNGEMSNTGAGIIGKVYTIPQQTDIVFSYVDQWKRWQPFGPPLIAPTKPIADHWVKPNREYIIFLEFCGMDAKGKCYYSLMPYAHAKSHSMYPIENGNVLDEKNALGFGTSVPVDVFKQHIRNKINEIKNYGE